MTSSGAADRRARATAIVHASEAAADPEVSLEELLPLVYDELRALAGAYLVHERIGHTLQPTALVHEAYLRLVDQTKVRWRGRVHFFAIGARMMRRVLIDYARRRQREKRGGDRRRVTLPAGAHEQHLDLEDLLALDEALSRLGELSPRQARVVELRYFAGLQVDETARLLGVSKRTVEGDWTHARAWLKRELGPSSS